MKSIKITNITSGGFFQAIQDQINQLEGWEYSSVREVVEDISGPQSSIYITSKFGRRRLSFTCLKKEMCLDDRVTMLGVFRQTGILKLLEFTTLDDLALRAEIEILAVRYPYNALQKPFLIEMVAPDWRFYSQALHTETVEVGMSTIMANAGNELTDSILKVYGPLETATITNLSTAETTLLDYSLSDGDYIEINSKTREILLNGITPVYAAFSGEFLSLIPGNNEVQLQATSSGANTELSVIYRDAYNGV